MNTRVEVFPSNLVAGMFGFTREEYFEVETATVRQTVDVSFEG
jgi:LemA protein